MQLRALGVVAIMTALTLSPTTAHAAGPATHPQAAVISTVAPSGPETNSSAVAPSTVAAPLRDGRTADPADPLSQRTSPDPMVVLGLIALLGGTLLVVLLGHRRPDDDEPVG